MGKKQRAAPEINASSMADIAFLLLIFFLVTTTIASDKGLSIMLPPKKEDNTKPPEVDVNQRNLFKVLVNSKNQLLVEEELMPVERLKETAKKFIDNNGRDAESSESPEKAIISLKTDRGTSYETYIRVMDELKAAYNELRADYMGVTIEEYLELDNKSDGKKNPKVEEARKRYPMQISEAEPSSVEGGPTK